MKTSGVGKGGALILAAGAVAVGITGCAGADGKPSAAQDAAAAASTTTTAATTADHAVTAAGTSSSAPSPASLPMAPAAMALPNIPAPKPTEPPNPPKPTSPAAKPKYVAPVNWLQGVPLGHNTPGKLDPRCLTGRVICVDMSTRTLLWVVDGKPQYGMDVRFGDAANPTRKGQFSIYMKMKNCISNLYHTSMPDAMFFSGGEAVHFSIDFATYGYAHHSHGCVNVRDRAAVERLFADTRVGDKVVVY